MTTYATSNSELATMFALALERASATAAGVSMALNLRRSQSDPPRWEAANHRVRASVPPDPRLSLIGSIVLRSEDGLTADACLVADLDEHHPEAQVGL
jgi:hypothetical protein